jgi:hypothetical protein
MAIILELNYGKTLSLPSFSSHHYELTLTVELTDLTQVKAESSRLNQLLQACVDREIQKTGYLPKQVAVANRTDLGSGERRRHAAKGNQDADCWACSPRQKNLVLRIVSEHRLDKAKVEALARERFGKSIRTLNKPEISVLISELDCAPTAFQ